MLWANFGLRLSVRLVAVCASLLVGTGGAQAKRTDGGLQVLVDVGGQSMEVYVDGQLRHRWAVSTGRDGYDTPGGTFRPQRLEREWYSRQYDNAPMPHAVFFSGGYAIHGTNETRRLGRQASHGCIRLSPGNAARLFSMVQEHGPRRTRIVIDNG
jgi:lipoprotein-anchoring transpeptidase ErfK/SrfK